MNDVSEMKLMCDDRRPWQAGVNPWPSDLKSSVHAVDHDSWRLTGVTNTKTL
jgi:hypothetical protein